VPREFFYSITSRPALGPTQLPIQWAPEAFSPGVKRPGREADNSSVTIDEVNTGGAIPLLPHMSSWRGA
jgi:hypothetical protein